MEQARIILSLPIGNHYRQSHDHEQTITSQTKERSGDVGAETLSEMQAADDRREMR